MPRAICDVLIYSDCAARLGRRDRRRLCCNTWLERRPDGFSVRLIGTDVVTVLPCDRWRLASGGWASRVTARRINGYSPASVYIMRGVLFLRVDGCGVPFVDGVIVDAMGRPVS